MDIRNTFKLVLVVVFVVGSSDGQCKVKTDGKYEYEVLMKKPINKNCIGDYVLLRKSDKMEFCEANMEYSQNREHLWCIDNDCRCGTIYKDQEEFVEIDQAGWLVNVKNEAQKKYCAGALLSHNIIITSQQCCRERDDVSAEVGGLEFSDLKGTYHKTEVVFPDPEDIEVYELCLLQFTDFAIKYSETVHPICLPELNENYNDNMKIHIQQWGRIDFLGDFLFKNLPGRSTRYSQTWRDSLNQNELSREQYEGTLSTIANGKYEEFEELLGFDWKFNKEDVETANAFTDLIKNMITEKLPEDSKNEFTMKFADMITLTPEDLKKHNMMEKLVDRLDNLSMKLFYKSTKMDKPTSTAITLVDYKKCDELLTSEDYMYNFNWSPDDMPFKAYYCGMDTPDDFSHIKPGSGSPVISKIGKGYVLRGITSMYVDGLRKCWPPCQTECRFNLETYIKYIVTDIKEFLPAILSKLNALSPDYEKYCPRMN